MFYCQTVQHLTVNAQISPTACAVCFFGGLSAARKAVCALPHRSCTVSVCVPHKPAAACTLHVRKSVCTACRTVYTFCTLPHCTSARRFRCTACPLPAAGLSPLQAIIFITKITTYYYKLYSPNVQAFLLSKMIVW